MDLEELYRQVIMDHYKNPRNKGLENTSGYIKLHLNNPSCGDDMTVCLLVDGDIIKDIKQDGKGCSICCSSASVMSLTLIGKKLDEALSIIKLFYNLVSGEVLTDIEEEKLGEAVVYKGVSKFPARIKCSTLSWKAIEQAIYEVKK